MVTRKTPLFFLSFASLEIIFSSPLVRSRGSTWLAAVFICPSMLVLPWDGLRMCIMRTEEKSLDKKKIICRWSDLATPLCWKLSHVSPHSDEHEKTENRPYLSMREPIKRRPCIRLLTAEARLVRSKWTCTNNLGNG